MLGPGKPKGDEKAIRILGEQTEKPCGKLKSNSFGTTPVQHQRCSGLFFLLLASLPSPFGHLGMPVPLAIRWGGLGMRGHPKYEGIPYNAAAYA